MLVPGTSLLTLKKNASANCYGHCSIAYGYSQVTTHEWSRTAHPCKKKVFLHIHNLMCWKQHANCFALSVSCPTLVHQCHSFVRSLICISRCLLCWWQNKWMLERIKHCGWSPLCHSNALPEFRAGLADKWANGKLYASSFAIAVPPAAASPRRLRD